MSDGLIDVHQIKEKMNLLAAELKELQEHIDHDEVMDRLLKIKEEIANSITHGIGVVFFIIAIPILLAYCTQKGSFQYTVCAGVFAFGLMMVYLSSTLYHSIQQRTAKRALRIIDHISIFLLIGGSYTPIAFHYLDKKTAIVLLVVVWFFVAIGCVYKVFFTGKYRFFSTLLYLVLGWLVVFVIKPLMISMPTEIFQLLAIGGVFYTLGVPFYLWRSYRYSHAIWHVFVLGGSVSHFFVILESAPLSALVR